MRIAIYSRKSVATNKGDSIGNQIQMCKDYMFNRIPNLLENEIFIYEDEGFSAKDLNRPQFQKMLADCKKKKFDYIVCYRLDRISRSVSDFSNLIEDLNNREIAFICINEQFDTSTSMGRAMMYIASVFAQLERETLAERVRDNMYLLARTGRWLGGTTPTGFDSERLEQVIVDGETKTFSKLKFNDEIEKVKIIYQKFLELYSVSGVNKYLIRQNIKSNQGKFYSVLGIRDILKNPVYCVADKEAYNYFSSHNADLCFQEKECDNISGLAGYCKNRYTKTRTIKNDVSEWIVAKGQHRGIISGKDWVAVQNRLEANKPKHKEAKPHNNYSLLSGVLYCKKCGEKMFCKNRTGTTSQEGLLFDYICSSKMRGNVALCDCKNLHGTITDTMVCDSIIKFTEPNSEIFLLLENLKKKYQTERTQSHKFDYKYQIEKRQKEIDNLINSVSASSVSKSLIQRIDSRVKELENEIQDFQFQIQQQEAEQDEANNSTKIIDDFVKQLSTFSSSFSSATTQEKREFLRQIIKKIEWNGEDLHIFSCGEV